MIYGWSHGHVLFSSETNVLLAAVGVPPHPVTSSCTHSSSEHICSLRVELAFPGCQIDQKFYSQLEPFTESSKIFENMTWTQPILSDTWTSDSTGLSEPD